MSVDRDFIKAVRLVTRLDRRRTLKNPRTSRKEQGNPSVGCGLLTESGTLCLRYKNFVNRR